MYTSINFRSKKAIKQALLGGEKITVFQPNNMFGGQPQTEGRVFLEGPHYPEPHKWYAEGILRDGYLVSIK